jgi:hypothetical protein
MKKILLIIYCIILVSCTKEEPKDLDFLIGNWIRLNDKTNHQTYESWNSNLTGIGYTLKGTDTVFKEILSIIKKNDTLFLQVEGVNESPTLFKFTSMTKTSFVCENPLNDFPQKIDYKKEFDTLKAIISSDGYSSVFKFIKSQ